MKEEFFSGYIYGLLVAALICEDRAGNRASHNAMAIMTWRRTEELKRAYKAVAA